MSPMGLSDAVPENTLLLDEEYASYKRSIVGSLLYITLKSKPDISTSGSVLVTYVSTPRHEYFIAARSVLYYLCGAINYLVILQPIQDDQLLAY